MCCLLLFPLILQRASFLPETDQFSMWNLPRTVNLPEQIFETDETECDLPENIYPVQRGSLPADVNDVQDEQYPVSSKGSESNKEMDEVGSGEYEEEGMEESNEIDGQ